MISEYWTFGLQNPFIFDLRTFGLKNIRTKETSDSRTFELTNLRTYEVEPYQLTSDFADELISVKILLLHIPLLSIPVIVLMVVATS